MDQQAQETMKAQLAKLPGAIRRAIADVGLRARLGAIAGKNGLRLDQAGLVEDEVMLVMLGLEGIDDLINNLVRNGGLSRDIAQKVATDVNESIFKEIRHLLIEMHQKEESNKELMESAAGAGAPATVLPAQPPPAPPTVPAPPPVSGVKTFSSDIAQARLSGNMHLPSDTVRVKEATAPPVIQKPFDATQGKPPSPVQKGTYTKGSDPYREPVK